MVPQDVPPGRQGVRLLRGPAGGAGGPRGERRGGLGAHAAAGVHLRGRDRARAGLAGQPGPQLRLRAAAVLSDVGGAVLQRPHAGRPVEGRAPGRQRARVRAVRGLARRVRHHGAQRGGQDDPRGDAGGPHAHQREGAHERRHLAARAARRAQAALARRGLRLPGGRPPGHLHRVGVPVVPRQAAPAALGGQAEAAPPRDADRLAPRPVACRAQPNRGQLRSRALRWGEAEGVHRGGAADHAGRAAPRRAHHGAGQHERGEGGGDARGAGGGRHDGCADHPPATRGHVQPPQARADPVGGRPAHLLRRHGGGGAVLHVPRLRAAGPVGAPHRGPRAGPLHPPVPRGGVGAGRLVPRLAAAGERACPRQGGAGGAGGPAEEHRQAALRGRVDAAEGASGAHRAQPGAPPVRGAGQLRRDRPRLGARGAGGARDGAGHGRDAEPPRHLLLLPPLPGPHVPHLARAVEGRPAPVHPRPGQRCVRHPGLLPRRGRVRPPLAQGPPAVLLRLHDLLADGPAPRLRQVPRGLHGDPGALQLRGVADVHGHRRHRALGQGGARGGQPVPRHRAALWRVPALHREPRGHGRVDHQLLVRPLRVRGARGQRVPRHEGALPLHLRRPAARAHPGEPHPAGARVQPDQAVS
mmetsp:Transcript_15869/g.54190  ORF Transcript_15869/g.54190 Transcript_15869/m.54190 type:complete len:640 (+) Transcript_15869:1332-3251(+)